MAAGDGAKLEIAGATVGALALDVVHGDPAEVLPPVSAGRLPLSPGEIALGRETMRQTSASIGDRIEFSFTDLVEEDTAIATVVGEVVLPQFDIEGIGGGEGAVLPNRWLYDAFDVDSNLEDDTANVVFLALQPDAGSRRRTGRGHASAAGSDHGWVEILRSEPTDLVNFSRTRSLPLVLGGMLLVVAARGTPLHPRRRRPGAPARRGDPQGARPRRPWRAPGARVAGGIPHPRRSRRRRAARHRRRALGVDGIRPAAGFHRQPGSACRGDHRRRRRRPIGGAPRSVVARAGGGGNPGHTDTAAADQASRHATASSSS